MVAASAMGAASQVVVATEVERRVVVVWEGAPTA